MKLFTVTLDVQAKVAIYAESKTEAYELAEVHCDRIVQGEDRVHPRTITNATVGHLDPDSTPAN